MSIEATRSFDAVTGKTKVRREGRLDFRSRVWTVWGEKEGPLLRVGLESIVVKKAIKNFKFVQTL
jgi:hypothetical protein